MREETYEQSICYGFMKIMKYICQQNSSGEPTKTKKTTSRLTLTQNNPIHFQFTDIETAGNDSCHFRSTGDYLGMTIPIVTVVHTNENHSVISRDVTVAYHLPIEHQAQPPQPLDSEIVIEIWPHAVVYTR